MSKAKIVVLGLAFSCAGPLPGTLRHLQKMTSQCADFRIVILESNSTDSTRPVLQKWTTENPQKHILLGENRTRQIRKPANKNHTIRYQKMGMLRNILLEEYSKINKTFPHDYMLMMDLDIFGTWDLDETFRIFNHGLLQTATATEVSTGTATATAKVIPTATAKVIPTATGNSKHDSKAEAWDAIACMCLHRYPGGWFPCSKKYIVKQPDWMYFDQLAFRDSQGRHVCTQFTIPPKNTTAQMNYSKLVPVQSAFGALCIYKRSIFDRLPGLRYIDNYAVQVCEHVTFHETMIKAGLKLFVDPSLELYYQDPNVPRHTHISPKLQKSRPVGRFTMTGLIRTQSRAIQPQRAHQRVPVRTFNRPKTRPIARFQRYRPAFRSRVRRSISLANLKTRNGSVKLTQYGLIRIPANK